MNTKQTLEAIADYLEANGKTTGEYVAWEWDDGENSPPACVLGAWYMVSEHQLNQDTDYYDAADAVQEWAEDGLYGEVIETLQAIALNSGKVCEHVYFPSLDDITTWSDSSTDEEVINALRDWR